jgi:type I restriction enzyme S subunit
MIKTGTDNKLPDNWSWVSLREISEVISKGTTPTTLGHAFTSTGIPFLRAEDVNGGAVEPSKVAFHISPETHSFLGRSQLQPGDFLITIAGTLGRIGYVPPNAPSLNCNQAVAFVRLKPEVIDVKFASFICQCEEVINSLLELKKVGTIGNLNLEQVGELKIPLPPISEQRRILAIAQKADRLRRTRRYALQLSDTYLQSVFLEMFGDPVTNPKGWEITRLETLLETSPQNGLYVPKEIYENRASNNGVEMVHMSDLFYGIVNRGNLKRVNLSPEDTRKYSIDHTDLLVARRSLVYEGAAKPCRIPESKDPLVFESSIIRLKVNTTKLLPVYLYYYLSNERARFAHVLRYVTESTISGINQNGLSSIEVIKPPLPLQEKFAQIVQKFERLRTQQREAERQAEHLFQIILHRAFRGELTSSDINEEPASDILDPNPQKPTKPETTVKTGNFSTRDAAKNPDHNAKPPYTESIQLNLPGFE